MNSLLVLSLIWGSVLGLSDRGGFPPCPSPQRISFGLSDWVPGKSVARYACFKGYHLVGNDQLECRYGIWYSSEPPSCRAVLCPSSPPEFLPHAKLSLKRGLYRYGSEASLICEEGYEIPKGAKSKIHCRSDGTWEGPRPGYFPSCKEKHCSEPLEVANGSYVLKGGEAFKPGSVIIYSCMPGFILLPPGSGKRACSKGRWTGPAPSCVPLSTPPKRSHCPPPPLIGNGHYVITNTGRSETPLALPVSEGEDEKFQKGTVLRYLCKEGFSLRRLHGQDLYQCKSNGEWSPKYPPICIDPSADMLSDPLEEAMCPSPSPVPHADYERISGLLTSNGVLHGTVLEYNCHSHYRDMHTPCLPARRTCHAGKWTGKEPTCGTFKFCVQPPAISHGFMLTPAENAYPVYSSIEYRCQPGYRMKGSSTLKCLNSGCWIPNILPQCVRVEFFESSSWNGDSGLSGEDSQLPAVALLVSVTVGCAVVALVTTVCLLIICRRKGGPSSPSQGPAHWSTTVTVTPECRPREPLSRRQDQDRMALIAFADGVQQVTLPSYEEALRDSIPASASTATGHFPEYDNPNCSSSSSAGILSGGLTNSHHLRPTVRTLNGRHGRRSRAMVRHEEPFQNRTQRNGGTCNAGRRGRRAEHVDTLSDTVSHHSIHVWPIRQPSQTASLKSGGSIASMDTVGGQSFSQVSGQSDNTVTTETSSTSNSSQTPSCRALAGSLASFESSSIINTEGVPLLEENELETERSNSSGETGDTLSASYSETSSKH